MLNTTSLAAVVALAKLDVAKLLGALLDIPPAVGPDALHQNVPLPHAGREAHRPARTQRDQRVQQEGWWSRRVTRNSAALLPLADSPPALATEPSTNAAAALTAGLQLARAHTRGLKTPRKRPLPLPQACGWSPSQPQSHPSKPFGRRPHVRSLFLFKGICGSSSSRMLHLTTTDTSTSCPLMSGKLMHACASPRMVGGLPGPV